MFVCAVTASFFVVLILGLFCFRCVFCCCAFFCSLSKSQQSVFMFRFLRIFYAFLLCWFVVVFVVLLRCCFVCLFVV